jgi:hypothetical protein
MRSNPNNVAEMEIAESRTKLGFGAGAEANRAFAHFVR